MKEKRREKKEVKLETAATRIYIKCNQEPIIILKNTLRRGSLGLVHSTKRKCTHAYSDKAERLEKKMMKNERQFLKRGNGSRDPSWIAGAFTYGGKSHRESFLEGSDHSQGFSLQEIP
jgi:hypothetical protein